MIVVSDTRKHAREVDPSSLLVIPTPNDQRRGSCHPRKPRSRGRENQNQK